MSARERWEALMNRQPVDRVSFFPMGNAPFCCKNVGFRVLDAFTNPAKYVEAMSKTADQYGFFPFAYATSSGSYGAWEFGGDIRMPTSEYEMSPAVVRYPAQSEEDVWKLKLPDVETAGSIPNNIKLSRLQEAVPGMPIVPAAHAVLTLSGNLVGVENLCRWMIKKPELVHHLVRLAADHIVDVAVYWANNFDPKRIIFYSAAATESNQLISPKQFEKFVVPYQKEAHEKILALGIKHIYVHICGDQNLNLPFWQQIPMGNPGILSFGHEVDLATAAKAFPNHIIAGNVNPPILHMGTGEEIYELSRECIEKGKKASGGFMLAAGCGVSPLTPPYSYWAMHKALDDFGWYV